jgi:hypothetical protein
MKKHSELRRGSASLRPLLLLGYLGLSACDDVNCIKGEDSIEQRTLSLQPFTEIEAKGDFIVYVTQGPTQQVEVKGERNILDQLNTRVRTGTLDIEHEDCVRRSKQVEVYITMPEVKALALNGSGRIYSENTLEVNELRTEVNGSGKVGLDVEAAKVITRVTGSGEVQLHGVAQAHSINMSGSGTAAAFDLEAEDVSVNLSGSGTAEVSASKTLSADVSGSGKVFYYGNPSVNTNISGSGKVVKK